jgi:uncharacterized protein YbjT (DUF2867 family)
MPGKILVLGATGTVGTQLVLCLDRRGAPVRAATRRPGAYSSGNPGLTEAIEFDFDRPETFGPALAGVDRVFLLARPGDEQADRTLLPLIDLMKRSGVTQVVNLSAFGVDRLEDTALRRIERHLEASGLTFTHLRPNWFMQIFSAGWLAMGLRMTGHIRLPAAEARISFVDVRDIAEVAAEALLDPRHAGRAYALTGAEALDHAEVARLVEAAAKKPVRYDAVSEEVARAALESSGLPQDRVERLLGLYRLVRQGFSSPILPDIEAVLGRPPRGFAQYAHDYAHAWS